MTPSTTSLVARDLTRAVPGRVTALGLAFVGDLVASATGVRPGDAGLASGLINTSQQIGGAVGLAVTTTIAAARTTSLLHSGHPAAAALTGGFHDAFAVTGALALAAAAVAAGFVRRAPAAAPAAPPASPGPGAASPDVSHGDRDDN